MKKTLIVVGIFIVSMIAAAGIFWGCSRETATESQVVTGVNIPPSLPAQSPRPDTIIPPAVLGYGSMDGKEIIDKVAALPVMQSYFQSFGNAGYEYSPENSYVAIGKGLPDGYPDSILVTVTTLAMKYDVDTMRQVLYVSHAKWSRGELCAAWEVSFVARDTTDGFESVEPNLWMRSYPIMNLDAARTPSSSASADPTKWCWKCWGKCVATRTLEGCGGGVAGCVWTGPGYSECVAVICTAAVVGSLIGCTISQIW